jgi:hypothetical protein
LAVTCFVDLRKLPEVVVVLELLLLVL